METVVSDAVGKATSTSVQGERSWTYSVWQSTATHTDQDCSKGAEKAFADMYFCDRLLFLPAFRISKWNIVSLLI